MPFEHGENLNSHRDASVNDAAVVHDELPQPGLRDFL